MKEELPFGLMRIGNPNPWCKFPDFRSRFLMIFVGKDGNPKGRFSTCQFM